MRNRRFPNYPDDTDYTTNATSYYDDLARKEKLIRLLAERIWGYEKILDETLEQIQERFRAWDKNLEDFPDDVKILLQQWLDDGTLDHIINDTIFNWKLDTAIFEQFRDLVTAQLQQTTSTSIKKLENFNTEPNYWDGAMIKALELYDDIVFPPGVYKFRNQISVKAWHKSIKGKVNVLGGHVVFEFDESGLFIESGSRYINFENIKLYNANKKGIGLQFGLKEGPDITTHYIDFNNVQIDNFDSAFEMNKNYLASNLKESILWNCTFKNMRIERCKTGLSNNDNTLNSFGLLFEKVYFNDCDKPLKISSFLANFESCNFGLKYIEAIDISGGSYVSFNNCNFECDQVITGSGNLLNMRKNNIEFKNSTFIIRGVQTVSVFGVHGTLTGLSFENCQYKSSPGNLISNFWSSSDVAVAINGAIQFLSGTHSIPRPTNWSGVYRSNYIDKLKNGLMLWDNSNNRPIENVGETGFHVQKNIPVVKSSTGLADFMGNLIDANYPIKISNNFFLDGGVATIPTGSNLVTIPYNRKKKGIFILGATPYDKNNPTKHFKVERDIQSIYYDLDTVAVIKAFEWDNTTKSWTDIISSSFDIQWFKISQ